MCISVKIYLKSLIFDRVGKNKTLNLHQVQIHTFFSHYLQCPSVVLLMLTTNASFLFSLTQPLTGNYQNTAKLIVAFATNDVYLSHKLKKISITYQHCLFSTTRSFQPSRTCTHFQILASLQSVATGRSGQTYRQALCSRDR